MEAGIDPSQRHPAARHASGARRVLATVRDGVSRIAQVTDLLPTLDTPGGAQICEVWHTRPGRPSGEGALRAGDAVVQRRAIHAWKNVSDAPAVWCVVMLGV